MVAVGASHAGPEFDGSKRMMLLCRSIADARPLCAAAAACLAVTIGLRVPEPRWLETWHQCVNDEQCD